MKLANAIKNLCPDAEFSYTNNDYSTVVWVKEPSVIPTSSEIEIELLRLTNEYNSKTYARNRVKEYPSIGDQLDALFHAGVFPLEMAASIQAVKDKYPKEEQ